MGETPEATPVGSSTLRLVRDGAAEETLRAGGRSKGILRGGAGVPEATR